MGAYEEPPALVILRRVVMDYSDTCCDSLTTCTCSMAQAARLVGLETEGDDGAS